MGVKAFVQMLQANVRYPTGPHNNVSIVRGAHSQENSSMLGEVAMPTSSHSN